MSKELQQEAAILKSWGKNAQPWTEAIRQGQIESRLLATNQAMVGAILRRSPQSVLDLGCGEGWLTRDLTARGIETIGVDAVPALVEQARCQGDGQFMVASYENIAAGCLNLTVDVVACNFSLFGETSVEAVVQAIPSLLQPHGALIVQTLHPLIACGDLPYQDGWRQGSWAGFSSDFSDPAPWYFRTLASWVAMISRHGLSLVAIEEPLHPQTQRPISMLLIAEPHASDR